MFKRGQQISGSKLFGALQERRRICRLFLLTLVLACCLAKADAPASPLPDAISLLSLMPENATAALIVPPLPGLTKMSMVLMNRLLPAGVSTEDIINTTILTCVPASGLTDIRLLSEYLLAKGFEPDAPAAVFVDLSPLAEEAAAVIESYKAGQNVGDAPEHRQAAFVAVLQCHDGEVAKESLREMIRAWNPILADRPEPRTIGNVCTYWLGDALGYSLIDGRLIVSNSVVLLAETFDRLTSPVPVPGEWNIRPGGPAGDAVLATRVGKIMTMVPNLGPLIAYVNPLLDKDSESVASAYSELGKAYAGDDFLVTTLSLTQDKVEILSRLDTGRRPRLAVSPNELSPLRFGAALSRSNLFNAAIRCTPTLVQFTEELFMVLPQILRTRTIQQVLDVIRCVLSKEIAVGVSTEGTLDAYGLAQVTEPEMLKAVLTELATSGLVEAQPGEVWRFTQAPIEVFLSFRDNILAVANTPQRCIGLLGLLDRKTDAPFMESLEPPVNPMSVLTLFSLDTQRLLPAATLLAPDMTAEQQQFLVRVTDTIREMRAGKTLDGTWQTSFLSLYLK